MTGLLAVLDKYGFPTFIAVVSMLALHALYGDARADASACRADLAAIVERQTAATDSNTAALRALADRLPPLK